MNDQPPGDKALEETQPAMPPPLADLPDTVVDLEEVVDLNELEALLLPSELVGSYYIG